jgi:hypothetical protein
MQEIDKYIVINIYLQPSHPIFHIKYNCRCHKIQQVSGHCYTCEKIIIMQCKPHFNY